MSRDAGRLRSASANSDKTCSRSVEKKRRARLKRKPSKLLRLKKRLPWLRRPRISKRSRRLLRVTPRLLLQFCAKRLNRSRLKKKHPRVLLKTSRLTLCMALMQRRLQHLRRPPMDRRQRPTAMAMAKSRRDEGARSLLGESEESEESVVNVELVAVAESVAAAKRSEEVRWFGRRRVMRKQTLMSQLKLQRQLQLKRLRSVRKLQRAASQESHWSRLKLPLVKLRLRPWLRRCSSRLTKKRIMLLSKLKSLYPLQGPRLPSMRLRRHRLQPRHSQPLRKQLTQWFSQLQLEWDKCLLR